MRFSRWVALATMSLFWASLPRASASDDEDVAKLRTRVGALEDEVASLRLRCWWLQQLRGHERRRASTGTATIGLVGRGRDAQRDRLRELQPPDTSSKAEVRAFVARIIIAAQDRTVFATNDAEVEFLMRVGSENVDVLIEPLVHLVRFDGSFHLVEALKGLAGNEHRHLVLQSLPLAPELIDVVVAKNWTAAAAPILLETLAQRSPMLDFGWIVAAASIAGPPHYDDLKWHLAHGLNPWPLWLAIRGLPGMEPLDEFVAAEWRSTTRDPNSWEGRSFAAVAAHYGQIEALGVLARSVRERHDWQQPFRELTGYQGPIEEATSWWERSRYGLVFDRATRRYVRSAIEVK